MSFIMKGVHQINKGTSKARTAIARNSNARKIKAKLDKIGRGRKSIRTTKKDCAGWDEQALFCVLNEREIFGCLSALLNENLFDSMSAQMVNLLIENSSRSTVA